MMLEQRKQCRYYNNKGECDLAARRYKDCVVNCDGESRVHCKEFVKKEANMGIVKRLKKENADLKTKLELSETHYQTTVEAMDDVVCMNNELKTKQKDDEIKIAILVGDVETNDKELIKALDENTEIKAVNVMLQEVIEEEDAKAELFKVKKDYAEFVKISNKNSDWLHDQHLQRIDELGDEIKKKNEIIYRFNTVVETWVTKIAGLLDKKNKNINWKYQVNLLLNWTKEVRE